MHASDLFLFAIRQHSVYNMLLLGIVFFFLRFVSFFSFSFFVSFCFHLLSVHQCARSVHWGFCSSSCCCCCHLFKIFIVCLLAVVYHFAFGWCLFAIFFYYCCCCWCYCTAMRCVYHDVYRMFPAAKCVFVCKRIAVNFQQWHNVKEKLEIEKEWRKKRRRKREKEKKKKTTKRTKIAVQARFSYIILNPHDVEKKNNVNKQAILRRIRWKLLRDWDLQNNRNSNWNGNQIADKKYIYRRIYTLCIKLPLFRIRLSIVDYIFFILYLDLFCVFFFNPKLKTLTIEHTRAFMQSQLSFVVIMSEKGVLGVREPDWEISQKKNE